MSKAQNPNAPGQANEHQCRGEDCKKKPELAGFCQEHFAWFKWGLITMQGAKSRDFEKKYQGFLNAKKQA